MEYQRTGRFSDVPWEATMRANEGVISGRSAIARPPLSVKA